MCVMGGNAGWGGCDQRAAECQLAALTGATQPWKQGLMEESLWAGHKETPGQSSVLGTPEANKTFTKTAGDGYNPGLPLQGIPSPFHHLIPPHPVASLGQYSPLPHRPNQQEAGVGWNLPVGFWSLTLFGVSGRHQLPYSWNMTGQGSCPAPSQLLGPQTNMANGSEPIHSSRVPLEGS